MGRVSAALFAISAALWSAGQYCGYRAALLFDDKSGLGNLEAARMWTDSQNMLFYGGLAIGLLACARIKSFGRAEKWATATVFGCGYAIATTAASLFQLA